MEYIIPTDYLSVQGVSTEIAKNYNIGSTVITTINWRPNMRKGSDTSHETYNTKLQTKTYTAKRKEA